MMRSGGMGVDDAGIDGEDPFGGVAGVKIPLVLGERVPEQFAFVHKGLHRVKDVPKDKDKQNNGGVKPKANGHRESEFSPEEIEKIEKHIAESEFYSAKDGFVTVPVNFEVPRLCDLLEDHIDELRSFHETVMK